MAQRRMLDVTTRWNARVATQVIAISETTRSDLMSTTARRPTGSPSFHHGVSRPLRPCQSCRTGQARVRSTYNLPDQFVLAVGTIQPRKNLAPPGRCGQSPAREKFPDLCLVIAGTRGWMAGHGSQRTYRRLLPVRRRFPRTRICPLNDLAWALLLTSSVAAMVSTCEGFGLPVLEAMRCGVPTRNLRMRPPSIEVAGDAALVAEATSVGDIAARIRANP